jgi:pimeloyl-ACP methyl ester carboxylesterase
MVVAPAFEAGAWPLFQQAVRRGRADRALIDLMDGLAALGLHAAHGWEMVGYSAGAQFAHRFAMLHPQRVARLSLVAAGFYTFPEHDAPFPYGLGPSPAGGRPRRHDWGPRLASGLDAFLRLPIVVAAGTEDVEGDEHLRRGETLDRRQGTDRVERARRWTAAVAEAARARAIASDVRFVPLAGCGHDLGECVATGGLDRLVLPEAAEPTPVVAALAAASRRATA